jgi:hypothetical protein
MATTRGRRAHRGVTIGDARLRVFTMTRRVSFVSDDGVMVDEEIAMQHDGADLQPLLSALNPVLERVVQERLEHLQDPQLIRKYSKPHAEGSWDHTG